ncbi:unnamed protein product, partial [Dicrocoelium dendriticum]
RIVSLQEHARNLVVCFNGRSASRRRLTFATCCLINLQFQSPEFSQACILQYWRPCRGTFIRNPVSLV